MFTVDIAKDTINTVKRQSKGGKMKKQVTLYGYHLYYL